MNNPIGLCSWSLQNDLNLINQTMEDAGISSLHLAVSETDSFADVIKAKGWTVTSMMVGFPQEDYTTLESIRRTGGIMPDDAWLENRQLGLAAIAQTAGAGVPYLSTHAGFIDHADPEGYQTFCTRMTELADAAREHGIMLLMETGQESAVDLRHCLNDLNHPALGVNFDPANMILYGKGDPVEAVEILAPWIRHVHIKDAVASEVCGEWGTELPWGDGAVDHHAFFQALEKIGFDGALAVEREAGDARREDIIRAVERLEALK